MKFKRIARVEVTSNFRNLKNGVNILTVRPIGEIGRLPTGEYDLNNTADEIIDFISDFAFFEMAHKGSPS